MCKLQIRLKCFGTAESKEQNCHQWNSRVSFKGQTGTVGDIYFGRYWYLCSGQPYHGHRFAKLDKEKFQKTIVQFVNRKNCKKVLFDKRLAVLIAVNMTLQKIEKPLQMRI